MPLCFTWFGGKEQKKLVRRDENASVIKCLPWVHPLKSGIAVIQSARLLPPFGGHWPTLAYNPVEPFILAALFLILMYNCRYSR